MKIIKITDSGKDKYVNFDKIIYFEEYTNQNDGDMKNVRVTKIVIENGTIWSDTPLDEFLTLISQTN